MLDLIAELGERASQALHSAFPHELIPKEMAVQPASKEEYGDLQIAGCLQLAKPLAKKPRDLALLLQAALATHPAVEKAEVAGPGYVNLFLRNSYLESRLAGLEEDPRLGLRPIGQGRTVVVDFSSPNIAKPMHIGHIRSTIIGDAVQRIFRALSYTVISDNHIGDWGTQFGKLIVAYRTWLDRNAYQREPINELVRLYQKFVAEEAKQAKAMGLAQEVQKAPDKDEADGPDGIDEAVGEPEETQKAATPLITAARAELAKLQQGDPENLALWREFMEASLKEFDKSYKRLGISFDVQLGESFYNDRLAGLVTDLLESGIAKESQGAVICEVEGETSPLLIRKGDGSFLYGTTDIATIEHRIKTWNPERILYVVGAPQQLHFRQVFKVAKSRGARCILEHVFFGSIRFFNPELNKWVVGRTRDGKVPLLEEFLDQAVERAEAVAREVSQKKNPDLSEDELKEIARVVGLGAVKYNDLCRDRVGDINFDLDKAVSLEGNTATYVQYAYARLRSIQRNADAEAETKGAVAKEPAPIRLVLKAERALARRVFDYPAAVEQAARLVKPHLLSEYLYGLAGAVNTFWLEVPVLKAEPAERKSRLRLLSVVARTLRHGLSLLGIEVLERM